MSLTEARYARDGMSLQVLHHATCIYEREMRWEGTGTKLNTLNLLQAFIIKQEVRLEVFTVSALNHLYITFTGRTWPVFCP
jgi:hypothetical protein